MRHWSQKRERYATRLRNEAAEPVIRRIRRHRREALGSFGPIFAALERHIFDRGFDVVTLCSLTDENPINISKRFDRVVGMPPRAYIMSCRLETGWGLLASDLKVWEIAEILGYRSIQVFTDAFVRWYGMRPKAYRDELGHLLRSGLVTPGDPLGRPTSENVMLAVVRKAPAAPPGKLARLRRFLRLDEAQPEPEIEPRYRRRRDRRCTWSGIDARKHPSSSGGG